MSLSNPRSESVKSPVSMYLRWSSERSAWTRYDKDAGAEVAVDADSPFIVLDQLNAVGGYSDAAGAAYRSTEVRHGNADLTLYLGGKQLDTGTWEHIKTNHVGTRFQKSVYACMKVGGQYQLIHISMLGSCLGAWFELQEEVGGPSKVESGKVIQVSEVLAKKKGATKYNQPVFKVVAEEISGKAKDIALEMDESLQAYFDSKGINGSTHAAPKQPDTAEPLEGIGEPPPDVDVDQDDDLPF